MLLGKVVDSRPEARKHTMSLEHLIMTVSLKTCSKDREASLKELPTAKAGTILSNKINNDSVGL